MDNTQSDRRMLSPVLSRIPWTTDVMRVLEKLDPNQKNGVCFTFCCVSVSQLTIDDRTGNNIQHPIL